MHFRRRRTLKSVTKCISGIHAKGRMNDSSWFLGFSLWPLEELQNLMPVALDNCFGKTRGRKKSCATRPSCNSNCFASMFWFKFATARARFPTTNIFDAGVGPHLTRLFRICQTSDEMPPRIVGLLSSGRLQTRTWSFTRV